MLNYIRASLLGTFLLQKVESHPTIDPFVVDLGYAKHKPTWVNTTTAGTELLNYNNIRFAQPPTGKLRFRRPQLPPLKQSGVQDGNITSWKTDCISSAPGGAPFPLLNGSTWGSEDCLFLNVVVPKNAKPGDKLPVLHWVVGSAYVFGGKDWTGFGINTYGLWNRPLNLSDQFIIVTHNYRLGISGWTPKLDKDMDGNLGVWDSLAAIQWTKKYISRFGGDPENITVIGQSAGAGIIEALLVAKNGRLKLPFNQAWIASPGIPPRRELERSRPVFDQVLNATGCSNINCIRQLPESKIIDANKYLFVDLLPGIGGGSLGPGVGFSITVDGDLLTDAPSNLLAQGKYNKAVKRLIVGNTASEGLGLSSDRDMPQRFPELVRASFPNISDASITKLFSLFPFLPESPGSIAWDWITELIFGCNLYSIAKAYPDKTQRYIFSVPPAFHGQDLSYFFYADNLTTPVTGLDAAYASQSYLLQFMFREDWHSFNPLAGSLSSWPVSGQSKMFTNITDSGFDFKTLPDLYGARCDFINSLIADPANGA